MTGPSAYALVLYAIIWCSFGAEYMEKKPAYLKTCQRRKSDQEFVPCSTESIQILFQKLATGIGGLDTLPTIDPIKLNKIKIFSGTGPVSLNTSLSDAVVTGFANTKVIRSYVNPVDYSWEANIRLPKIRIEGDYHMRGRILVLPLIGHGKCWLEPRDMDIVLSAKSKLYEKFGYTFYNVTEIRVSFDMSGLKLHLDNLFDGIKLLEDSTNDYLNENWKEVSEAFKPIIKKTIEDILLEIMNKIFNYMPANYLVSDIPTSLELYGTA